MKHNQSTYALLVRSEEKNRGALETIAYSTCILSVVVAIWQFAHQPVNLPTSGIEPGTIAEAVQCTSPC